MTVLYLRRVGNAFLPDGDESIAEMVRIPFGKPFRAEIKQPRNLAFHRLFWSLCARIAAGTGTDAERIASTFKLATGHVDLVRTKSYGDMAIPKSISFAKMDDAKFRVFFERCLIVAWEEWKLDPAEFADMLDPKTEKRA